MGFLDFLNPAKQAAVSGSKWAVKTHFKTRQINPSLSDKEIANNLLFARYMRVSLELDQESRLKDYEEFELANAFDLVMATLDVELNINPVHNPVGFAEAVAVVERTLLKAGVPLSTSIGSFEARWDQRIRPQR